MYILNYVCKRYCVRHVRNVFDKTRVTKTPWLFKIASDIEFKTRQYKGLWIEQFICHPTMMFSTTRFYRFLCDYYRCHFICDPVYEDESILYWCPGGISRSDRVLVCRVREMQSPFRRCRADPVDHSIDHCQHN